MADLTKAGLAIPPQVAELQDIGHLNRISVEKAKSRLSALNSTGSSTVPNGYASSTVQNGTGNEKSLTSAPILYGSETAL